jgi:hypothetical protein
VNQQTLAFIDERTIQERFEAFIAEHPDVPALFERFAREAREAGRKRFGAKAIAERIRWYFATSTTGDVPKLNNDFTSRLARRLAEQEPETFGNGFFEFRELRAE